MAEDQSLPAVKKLEGDPGKRKLNTKEPVPAKEILTVRSGCFQEAKKEERVGTTCGSDEPDGSSDRGGYGGICCILPVLCQMEGSAGAFPVGL